MMLGVPGWCHRCMMRSTDCPCPTLVSPEPAAPAESGERPRRDHILTLARTLLPQCLASMTFERWCALNGRTGGLALYHAERDEAAWRNAIALAERTFNGEPE